MGENQSASTKKKRDPGKTIEVLFKISEAVSNTRNLDELYQVIHKNLDEILNADNFYIALHHEEKDSITFPYYVDKMDNSPEEIFNFSQTPTLTGKVIRKKAPLIFFRRDFIQLSRQLNQKTLGMIPEIWIGAPLIINNRVKGAIVVQSYESATTYEKKDLDLLNSVSQHIALAIERKESDEKLTEQRKILEKILEFSPVGITLAQNRIFKWVNNEMVKMLGYQSKLDFENKSVRMLYSDSNDYDRAGSQTYASLRTTGTAEFEMDLVKKDKTLFPAHLRMSCGDISDPKAWTIATISDISQRKAVEKEKYEKERLQGVLEMAGAVCHEINQPLQAILGYSELLLIGSKSGNIKDNNIHSIKSQATRLGKITEKLSNITHYRTIDYPGNAKIVDIWGAGNNTEH
jgi:K+-sensing histidine kinase KdpD